MRAGLAMVWQHIAPADHLAVDQGDELAAVVGDDRAVEVEGLLDRGRLRERKKALLARHRVERGMQPGEMPLGDSFDRQLHVQPLQ